MIKAVEMELSHDIAGDKQFFHRFPLEARRTPSRGEFTHGSRSIWQIQCCSLPGRDAFTTCSLRQSTDKCEFLRAADPVTRI
jgi:hypothetical protein